LSAATTKASHIVCVELGGNISPEVYLPSAAAELSKHFTVLKYSQVWDTPPVSCDGCENFLNAALLIQTSLSFDELKDQFRGIEKSLGRVRTADKFAPRTIDIDTLLYGGEVMEPDIWDYAHLAVPVAELLPDLENQDTGDKLGNVAKKLIEASQIELRLDVTLG